MIVIRSGREAADHFRRLREYHGLSREDLAARIWVDRRTVYDRDTGRARLSSDALIETAAVFGFQVALVHPEEDRMTPELIPARYPHTRPTGTGWPA